MVEAAPSSRFEVAEPNLLFEFLVVTFDAPAQFGGVDDLMERRCSPEALRTNIWLAPLSQTVMEARAVPIARKPPELFRVPTNYAPALGH
jgi:hypothetical protein